MPKENLSVRNFLSLVLHEKKVADFDSERRWGCLRMEQLLILNYRTTKRNKRENNMEVGKKNLTNKLITIPALVQFFLFFLRKQSNLWGSKF